MLVIAFHEFSHALACLLTGGRVESISLDPREGGVTHMRGGVAAFTLPAGYLGSSLVGALLTFCGFNVVASKVASIVLGVCFLLTLWWGKRDWLTILTVLLAMGLLAGCWFIAHAQPLRFVVLFIGVMSSLYSVWDIVSAAALSGRSHTQADANLPSTVRRSHPQKSQQLGRQRFRQALWRLVAVLGRHLVHHLRSIHGRRHCCRYRCFPAVVPAAGTGLVCFHSDKAIGGDRSLCLER